MSNAISWDRTSMQDWQSTAWEAEETAIAVADLPDAEHLLAQRFAVLSDNWQRSVRHISSTSQRTSHPSYLAIIALGEQAIPLILRELEARPNHWFAALRALSKTDPVAPGDKGNMDAMATAWINWGKASGYLA